MACIEKRPVSDGQAQDWNEQKEFAENSRDDTQQHEHNHSEIGDHVAAHMNMHVTAAAISGILVQTVHHRWFEVNNNEMFNKVFFVCARVDMSISLFFLRIFFELF